MPTRKVGKRGNGEGSIYQDAEGRWRSVVDLGYRNGKLPGRLIVREHESDEEKAKAPPLPDDYRAAATATANRQAAIAGYRLAALLREVAAATRKQ